MEFLIRQFPHHQEVTWESPKQYFHKADALFSAMQARTGEIDRQFSETTKQRIMSDYEELRAALKESP